MYWNVEGAESRWKYNWFGQLWERRGCWAVANLSELGLDLNKEEGPMHSDGYWTTG
jgi:hypothetical protein